MNNFNNNERRQQELEGRPIADAIYRQTFGDDVLIERMDREDSLTLDIRFAIDVQLTLPTGQILLGQEKFLSHKYASFKSVTVEYMQNQFTQERGDWFKLAVQFYFVGYLTKNKDGFAPWIILNWPEVVIATHKRQIVWNDNKNKDGRARASFRYYPMNRFPPACVITGNF